MKAALCLIILVICLGTAYCQGESDAKTCSFCHPTAGVCSLKAGFVTCTCASGYIGNGVNCTLMSYCGSVSCCPQGYAWNTVSKACVDINECNDNTLNKCVPSSTCVNKNGIYLCNYNRSINCPTSACSYDMDCVNINGVEQCADPCLNYQTLNGSSRLATLDSAGIFQTDRYNFGWFRYNGNIGLRMIEGCVNSLKCGSAEPFSLGGKHPVIGDGIQLVTLKKNSLTGCVNSSTIPVKACSEGYYVYKFTGSLQFDVYCTDPNFTISSTIPTKAPSTTPAATTTPATTTTLATTTTPTTPTVTSLPSTSSQAPTVTSLFTSPDIFTSGRQTTVFTSPQFSSSVFTTNHPNTSSPVSGQNITVTTIKTTNTMATTSKTQLVNSTEIATLEVNQTTNIFTEVKVITPITVQVRTNSSLFQSTALFKLVDGVPLTFTNTQPPNWTGCEQAYANSQPFQSQLYNSTPVQTTTTTETTSVDGKDFRSTTTTTTTTTEEVIVAVPNSTFPETTTVIF
uniref:Mucin-3A-like n=1 Tax=Xenopus tropicalis TaxID=8364 RepID=A0A6I8PP51_XENTR